MSVRSSGLEQSRLNWDDEPMRLGEHAHEAGSSRAHDLLFHAGEGSLQASERLGLVRRGQVTDEEVLRLVQQFAVDRRRRLRRVRHADVELRAFLGEPGVYAGQ